MKIIISQKPSEGIGEEFNEYEYSLNAEIEITEDANATEAVLAMVRALKIEGYLNASIISALKTAADYVEN